MINLKGKLGQIPGSTAVIKTEVYTYFTLMAEALKRDKGVELKVEQSYLSKFEVTDELRKIVKDKTGNSPAIAAMLNQSVRIEDILGVTAQPIDPANTAVIEPTFPANSYKTLEDYIKTLPQDSFDPPLYIKYRSPIAEFMVHPYPNHTGLDPRQTGNLVVIGPKDAIKPDILNWIYNNSIFYGFIPYGNPQIQSLYFAGVDQLKQKVKVLESVVKVVSTFLQMQLSPDIITITIDKVLTHSLTGATEFINPGTFDYAIGTIPDNNKIQIQVVLVPGEGLHLFREDVATAYFAMRESAKKDGVKLVVNSAFRPAFKLEGGVTTKSGKTLEPTTQYGIRKERKPNKDENFWLTAPASAYDPAVAPPGSSNHGSGIAIDLNTGGYAHYPGNALTDNGRVFEWLTKNAHRFGFIRGVSSEVWHWEYYPPTKPGKKNQVSTTGPYTMVPKSHPTWGPYNNVDWESQGGFEGSKTT